MYRLVPLPWRCIPWLLVLCLPVLLLSQVSFFKSIFTFLHGVVANLIVLFILTDLIIGYELELTSTQMQMKDTVFVSSPPCCINLYKTAITLGYLSCILRYFKAE